jgi:hypothetical protein
VNSVVMTAGIPDPDHDDRQDRGTRIAEAFMSASRREFSEAEAVASRNSLYHILDLNAAIRSGGED